MDIGVIVFPPLGKTAETAQMIEGLGFASMLFPDSQNLAPEVWGQLMLAAAATYMREHTRAGATHAAGLSDAFVDWFAIVGPPDRALPRFQQLAALGLDFLRVVPGSLDMPRDIAAASVVNLANEIVPALRG